MFGAWKRSFCKRNSLAVRNTWYTYLETFPFIFPCDMAAKTRDSATHLDCEYPLKVSSLHVTAHASVTNAPLFLACSGTSPIHHWFDRFINTRLCRREHANSRHVMEELGPGCDSHTHELLRALNITPLESYT